MKSTHIMMALASAMLISPAMAAKYTLSSPEGVNKITVSTDKGLTYQVSHNRKSIMEPSPIALTVNGKELGVAPKVISKKKNSKDQYIYPAVKEKRAKIHDAYNELELTMDGGYGVRFRAYDNGVAYRIFTNFGGKAVVAEEEIVYNFKEDYVASMPQMDGFFSHYERPYVNKPISEYEFGEMGGLPSMVTLDKGVRVAITEADLDDYPGFYLQKGAEEHQLVATFPYYPETTYQPTDRDIKVATREPFMAKTDGTRDYPWRLMVITDNDAELIDNTLVYQLAPEQQIKDTSWVKPGKVAWDWYNMNNIEGVDFEAGVNTQTYKYYIDFAAKYGLEYIILDEGWYDIETNDLLNPLKEVDVKELINYGNKKGVGVILWVTWTALEDHFKPALAAFEKWGAKGIKVDFMQRDDQPMVDFYERTAKAAAEHKLLVNFHGSYKPAGLRRAYPNVITREGVRGLENNKWEGKYSNPEYCLSMPFLRMLAGPVDYTPGAMANAQEENYAPIWNRPMSLGTRAHQLGMYVVYESPLQMLADAPSSYLKDTGVMPFLEAVPTTWDETKVLQAQYSDYVLIARRNGDTWYVGAMTDWTPRDLKLDLSDFLERGKYTMDIWQDGPNADKRATDYQHVTKSVSSRDTVKLHMAPGGGWVAIIKKK